MRFAHDPATNERVIPIDLGFRQEAAVPGPSLPQTESRAFLVFWLSEPVGTRGIVERLSCSGAVLGGLNDEAIGA